MTTTIPISRQTIEAQELQSGITGWTLYDEYGTAVPASVMTSVTLTLYDVATGAIINGRNGQAVPSVASGVTADENGNWQWQRDPADSPIADDRLAIETHMAIFVFVWGAGRRHQHEVQIRVQNLSRVP